MSDIVVVTETPAPIVRVSYPGPEGPTGPSGLGLYIGTTPPEDTSLIWVDIS